MQLEIITDLWLYDQEAQRAVLSTEMGEAQRKYYESLVRPKRLLIVQCWVGFINKKKGYTYRHILSIIFIKLTNLPKLNTVYY